MGRINKHQNVPIHAKKAKAKTVASSNIRKLTSLVITLLMLLHWQLPGAAAQSIKSTSNNKDTSALLIRHIYPFFARVNQDPAIRSMLTKYKPLRAIAESHQAAFKKALKHANLDTALRGLKWTAQQVTEISKALDVLYRKEPQFRALIKKLSDSHKYKTGVTDAKTKTPAATDSIFIDQMIRSIAAGMNYSVDTYLFGKAPQYAKIDAISIHLKDQRIRQQLKRVLLKATKGRQARLFYQLPLTTAIYALRLNGRTEAVLYDPLTGGMNRVPSNQVRTIDFSNYKYSAILVPGLGPEKPGVRLTEGGKARCRMAAAEFNKQEAPYLIVSGGHVHPNKTPFCEAVEMKIYMVDSLHMDESTILIEPYARHTTTNLRNATRLLYLLKIPMDKPVLIATDRSQSKYINNGMRKTSFRDLGYTPYSELRVITPDRTSFIPTLNSLRVNPLDPLDP